MPNKRWRVLATRPQAQNAQWSEVLQKAGYSVLAIPMLAIEAVLDEANKTRIKQQILNFDHYQHIIFVSQNAVEHCSYWLQDYWPQLPAKMSYFAVGDKTAEQVRQLLCASDVNGGALAMNTEAMLLLPELQALSGVKVLICRGRGGRTTLGDELAARGALLEYCELYQRSLPAQASEQLAVNDIKPATDVLVVFSGETLKNTLCAASGCGKLAEILSLPCVVPGNRVAELAKAQGFSRIHIAENASQDCMLNYLDREF
ncbi:uroporphyrinogen-III synthase [Alteromonadaceae bacterium Bs31]|nr:uroporphyrinogen-III synthase [Alteromonadaceae bacterium Bs31]